MTEFHLAIEVVKVGEPLSPAAGYNEVDIGDIQPHILYSCLYWADHLKDADFSDDLLKCLNSFLSERLLFWLEVLSHLKEFSRVASQALLGATDWISVRTLLLSLELR